MKQINITLKSTTDIFPSNEFFEVLDWCVNACSGKFIYTHVSEETLESKWLFQFENIEDETMFILRWL